MNRPLDAAEGATQQAAQQAAAAQRQAQAAQPARVQGLAGMYTRLIKQPGVFDGARAERADWPFTFRAYASAVSPLMTELLTQAEDKGPDPVDLPQAAELARANGQLYYVLVLLVKGAAMKKAKSAPVGHGAEVWRLLACEYELKQRRRFQAKLSGGLRTKLPDPLSESIDGFERQIKQCTD